MKKTSWINEVKTTESKKDTNYIKIKKKTSKKYAFETDKFGNASKCIKRKGREDERKTG